VCCVLCVVCCVSCVVYCALCIVIVCCILHVAYCVLYSVCHICTVFCTPHITHCTLSFIDCILCIIYHVPYVCLCVYVRMCVVLGAPYSILYSVLCICLKGRIDADVALLKALTVWWPACRVTNASVHCDFTTPYMSSTSTDRPRRSLAYRSDALSLGPINTVGCALEAELGHRPPSLRAQGVA